MPGTQKVTSMNKTAVRAAVAAVALVPTILLGSGIATAAPTLTDDGIVGPPAGVLLGSDALSLPAPGKTESWTCAVYQPSTFNLGFENGNGLNEASSVAVAPMLGDWKPGPVNGVCFGSQGFTTVPGTAG
jgi:hypothetical protein